VSAPARSFASVIWIAVAVLAVLHQDFWLWDDRRLVGGAIPAGLFYHSMFTLAATTLWALAIRYAWPHRMEAWADEVNHPAASQGGRHP
jgi:hypothetical protein